MSDSQRQLRTCLCGNHVVCDGEEAIERFGNVLCQDCAKQPVKFVADCDSELCDWSYEFEDTEFNRGHAKTRVHQEARHHQRTKRIFEDNPCHKTEVREVDA